MMSFYKDAKEPEIEIANQKNKVGQLIRVQKCLKKMVIKQQR